MHSLRGLTATLPVIVPNSFSGIGRYDPPSVSNTADRYETITDPDFEGSVMMIMRALMTRDRRKDQPHYNSGESMAHKRMQAQLMRDHRLFAMLFLWICHIVDVGGIASARADSPETSPRASSEINAGWRFQIDSHDLGERERWFAAGFDRAGWSQVEVPRAWDCFNEALRGYEGVGWYSVTLDGSWARAGKVQHLTFGRVMYHTKAWLNGEVLGEHTDGYLPFAFDVTGKLTDSANHLVMRVDNRPRIDWLPAAKEIEWAQYGGILQPVSVESTGPIFLSGLSITAIPQGDDAVISCGVDFTNREPADAAGLVLKISVLTGDRPDQAVPLAHLAASAVSVMAGTSSHQRLSLTLPRAKPWSPDSPMLYTLVASLERRGAEVDRLVSLFGVRTITARGRELLLNGRLLKVRGVNRYDEYGRFGPNPPDALVENELRLMKNVGVNLIRSHYPQAPKYLALCDRLGILFLEELPINWWGVDWFGKEGVVQDERILHQALPMLETMILRDRNHPSVIIWSMANESKTDNEIGIKVMRALIRRTKELDPMRLVTFVTAPGSVREHPAYEDADLVATNMYYGSLSAPRAEHRDQLEERVRRPTEEHLRRELAAFPDKPFLITEFGAIGMEGLHGDVPSTEDLQADIIRAVWSAISGVPDVAGGVLWSWADYQHRRHFQANGAFGAFGAVTIDRKPKSALKVLATMFGGKLGK
jgi:beta-galactosidase/beta-glucuronidase